MTNDLSRICVIGAGTMGRGIAQVAIAAGHDVCLVDPDPDQLEAATADMSSRLLRKHDDADRILSSRLRTAISIAETSARAGTVVIEAVVEDLQVKHAVFNEAIEHFGPTAILATNTSSLSITEIAAGTDLPSRVVGMHFFNPVPVMRLVEVVTGVQTDAAVAGVIAELATAWGKDVALVRSAPGFIVNRVARPFYGESLKLLEEGAASVETIDEALRAAGGFRMGPFELIDLIGSDVNFAVTRTVWEAYNYDPRFAPSQVQRELVAAKRFGRKTGRGFYRYGDGAERTLPEPARSSAPCPDAVLLCGDCEQLEGLLGRAGARLSRREAVDGPAVEIPGVGAVVVTRGRTAQEESQRRGMPVLVLDRCLDPKSVAGLAFSSTDAALTDTVVTLLNDAGVRGYPVADTPGLIVARIVAMLINEANEAVLHGVASPEDIDTAMMLGTNYPLGPFQWCQRWSPATVVEILDTMWAEYHDPRYRTSFHLRATARVSAQTG